MLASYTYSPYREPSEKVLTELIGSKSGIDILGDYKYERLDMVKVRKVVGVLLPTKPDI